MRKIKINNKSLGDLNGVEVQLTNPLYDRLKTEKRKDGSTVLKSFESGRALRGFKHLLETIRSQDPNFNIVFSDKKTERKGSSYHINYDDYRSTTGARFFALYRETGLEGAQFYLNKYFPDDFKYDQARISETQLKKVDRKFPELIDQLSQKAKNKRALLKQTTNVVKELSDKKRLLKEEVEQLDKLRQESNIHFFRTKLSELKTRLPKKYPETKGKNSWQRWIYDNTWLFGTHYQTAIEKSKVGFNNIPDYIFPSLDGFLDILEIKLPSVQPISKDPSHPGSYRWSSEASKAIGQVVNYLHEMELHQLELRQNIERTYGSVLQSEVYVIRPRAFILIGTKEGWNDEKTEAFRKLNYSLHGIEIITYTDLVTRGEQILALYSKNLSSQ